MSISCAAITISKYLKWKRKRMKTERRIYAQQLKHSELLGWCMEFDPEGKDNGR